MSACACYCSFPQDLSFELVHGVGSCSVLFLSSEVSLCISLSISTRVNPLVDVIRGSWALMTV